MLLNCGVGEDSWESLGLQGDPTSPSYRKSFLNIHWKARCWSWNSNTWTPDVENWLIWKGPDAQKDWVGGEGDDRGWDGRMASPTQWTWVWVGSGSWWWTGKPGVLHSMGLQRVGHDWVTELTDNLYTFHLQNVVFLLLYTRQLSHHQKCVSLTTMLLIPFSRSRLHTATSSPVTTRTLFPVSMRLFYLVCSAHLFCWLFVFCIACMSEIK